MTQHTVVSEEAWIAAHKAHLAKEKAFTRMRDELAEARRALPWRKVEKTYVFESELGPCTLSDLFDGRSQLFVKHFMFGPDWADGCVGCSFEADHIGGALVHLQHHDVSYVAVSRAPIAKIAAFKQRMGWQFPWVSSYDSDFNFDFHVTASEEEKARGTVHYNFGEYPYESDEMSGDSVFYKDANGDIFHTFSAYGRGAEELLSSYVVLDFMPKGRNEAEAGNLTDWVRHHDRYDAGGSVNAQGRYVPDAGAGDCCHSAEA